MRMKQTEEKITGVVISHAHSAVPPAALPLSYFLQGNAFPCPCQKFLPRCFGSVKNTENCIFCLFLL